MLSEAALHRIYSAPGIAAHIREALTRMNERANPTAMERMFAPSKGLWVSALILTRSSPSNDLLAYLYPSFQSIKSQLHRSMLMNRSAFNAGPTYSNFQESLTLDQLRKLAPSIFAASAHSSRSDRFTYLPTSVIVEAMIKRQKSSPRPLEGELF